ncbi:MAG: hypothetical protein ABSB42_10105 [Tepidisphaeraceae bacterium]|jgi:hypothetical protein
MNDVPEQSDGRVWERGWDDHERRQRARLAKLSLPEKLAWLEEAHRLVRQITSNSKNPRAGN